MQPPWVVKSAFKGSRAVDQLWREKIELQWPWLCKNRDLFPASTTTTPAMSDSESSASGSSSMSGSRSSSAELPSAASVIAKKAKPKSVRVAPDVQARDEGENPHWKLQPPPNYVLADHSADCGGFDWDAVENDEDVEVWLVRMPSKVCTFWHALLFETEWYNIFVAKDEAFGRDALRFSAEKYIKILSCGSLSKGYHEL